MTNEELVRLIQDNQNPKENLLALWEQNRPFIKSIVKKHMRYSEIDDLTQQAYIGIHKAAYSFDTESGLKFLTYAGQLIQGHIWEYINSCCRAVRIPKYAATRRREYLEIQEEVRNKLGREANDEEMRILLSLTQEQLDDIKQSFIFDNVKSLDERPGWTDDDSIALADCVASDEDIETAFIEREQCAELSAYIDGLPEDMREVVRLHYFEDISIMEIANSKGLKHYVVNGTKHKAIKKLRFRYKEKALINTLEYEKIRSSAMKGIGVARFNTTRTSATEREALQILGYGQ